MVRPEREISMTLRLLAILVLVLPAQDAAPFDPSKLARLRPAMQDFVDRKQAAGLVAALGGAEGIAVLEAVGAADLEAGVPMAKDTVFQIASMTKPITLIAVMLLADEGKLSVDDAVEKHLPEFKGQKLVKSKSADETVLVRAPRPITLKDLATHTSGLPGGPPAGLADLYSKRHRTLAEAAIAYSQMPLEFAPGAKWAYCNAGIDTLGRVVEAVSGKSFEAFLQERLFDPLGMKDTFFYPTEATLPRIAKLYRKAGDGLAPEKNFLGTPVGGKFPLPAGGLYSTAPDIARLCRALLAGGGPLSAASLARMTAVQTGDLKCGFTDGIGMGLGFQVVKEPKGVTETLSPGTYGHGGAFGTQYWIDPVRRTFAILMVQRSGFGNGDASELRRTLHECGAKG
jgi:CubicO group peptidase (beta-lactamase class C family)